MTGPTCSGKDNLVSELIKEIGKEKVAYLSDMWFNYALDKKETISERLAQNKTAEQVCEIPLLMSKLKELMSGKDILVPERKRKTVGWQENTKFPERKQIIVREDDKKLVKYAPCIIVEGKRTLQIPELMEMADLKLYVDADPDLRLIWKIKRSPYYKKAVGEEPGKCKRNFGNSKTGDFVECIANGFKMWEDQIRKFHKDQEKYKKNADLILINNSWEEFGANKNKVKEMIVSCLQDPKSFKKKLAEEKQKGQSQPKPEVVIKEIPALEKSIWKQQSTYLLMAGGFGIALLGLGIHYLIRKRKKHFKKK